jgi:hypothetical protein
MRTRTLACIVVVLAYVALPARPGETARVIRWSELQEEGTKLPGSVETGGQHPFGRLKITNSDDAQLARDLFILNDPPITHPRWALVGRVRYTDVEGKGLLEMWSEIEGESFFSRTLSESGPMAAFTGSSDWRTVILPFHSDPEDPPPQTIALNVQLPGKGTVWLSDLRLMQFGPHEDPVAAVLWPGAWWTGRQAGLLGGAIGALLGLLGALIGIFAGLGRARTFVIWGLRIAPVTGGILLAGGLLALLAGQPWWVFHPLLLVGAIWLAVPLAVRKRVQQQYEEAEMQKMQAMDVQ